MVELKNVYKSYKIGEVIQEVIKGLSLKIKKTEFVAIVGPSGSGKSTLLNMIGCLDLPDTGEIYINNTDISNLNDNEATDFRAKHLGFVFQDFNLIDVFNAFENVNFPLKVIHKINEPQRVEKLLEEIGMKEFMYKFPYQLSGGQKQRVAIARALIHKPSLVLADEPTANLDSVTSRKVIEVMRKMQRELKMTFIFATHDMNLIDEVDRVLYLKDGVIVKDERKNNGGI